MYYEKKSLHDLPIEEVLKAMEMVGRWITKMRGNPATGPLSEAMLGENAAVYFPKLAYCKLASGDWKWKDGLSLSTQMIRIVRTEMGHRLRDWKNKNGPDVFESLSYEKVAMEADKALSEEFVMEEETKELGYELIFKWLADYPELVKYVELVKELNDYRAISKRLRIKKEEVKELETRTLKVIAEARRRFSLG